MEGVGGGGETVGVDSMVDIRAELFYIVFGVHFRIRFQFNPLLSFVGFYRFCNLLLGQCLNLIKIGA